MRRSAVQTISYLKTSSILSYLLESQACPHQQAHSACKPTFPRLCLHALVLCIMQALAAFEGRTEVTPGDIYRVIPLCLRHRLRKDPMAEIDSGDKVRESLPIGVDVVS